MKNNNPNPINIKLWKKVAYAGLIFSFIISMLLIVNYLQFKKIDPVETELINSLIERLSENPKDNELREEIRTLDLLARKAFFTNQKQIRAGGYLLFFSLILTLTALQMIYRNKEKQPFILDIKTNISTVQLRQRKAVAAGGIFIIISAFISAYLSHNELKNTFLEASLKNDSTEIIENLIIKENEKPKITDNNFVLEENNKPKKSVQSESQKVEIPAPEKMKKKNKTSSVVSLKDTIPKEKTISEFPDNKEINSNFPCFRGPGGNGFSFHKNIPVSWDGKTGKNIIWKTPLLLQGYSSPVIWGDKLFITGASNSKREIYCFDRHSGKILWTAEANNISGSPAKSPKVTDDTGLAAATPVVDGRRIYSIFANGDIIAVDMNGKKVWAKNLGVPNNHYGHSSSLMFYRNILIVQYDHKSSTKLMALSCKSGQILWTSERKVKVSWASPIVVFTGKQTEIITVSEPFVASYNPFSGKENWKIDCIFGEVGPSLAYADGMVFSVNEYAKLAAVKLGEKPEILWESDELLSDVPSPVATKKYLILVTSYGVVACYDTKTGKKYWEQEFDDGFYSSPIIAENKVFLIDRQGIMHIFSVSDKFISISKPALGETTDCTPAFAEGRIYIRAEKNLYCIGKK